MSYKCIIIYLKKEQQQKDSLESLFNDKVHKTCITVLTEKLDPKGQKIINSKMKARKKKKKKNCTLQNKDWINSIQDSAT